MELKKKKDVETLFHPMRGFYVCGAVSGSERDVDELDGYGVHDDGRGSGNSTT